MVEINKVYFDDCFNIIEQLDDNSLDLVVTDPPYGDNIAYSRNHDKPILNNEDESINYRFMDVIYDKMKMNTAMYLFTNHVFVDKLKQYGISKGFNYRALCVLVKNNFGLGYYFRPQYELCLVFEKGVVKHNTLNMSNVWFMDHPKYTLESHPHEKDLDIISKIILHSSKENDLVFDGFMGSFTTAIACINTNRNFIGTELDKKYYDVGDKKIKSLLTNKNTINDFFEV